MHHRVIADARLAYRQVKGIAVMFVFTTREIIDDWYKITLPKDRGLERVVAEMCSSKIGVNFGFV